MAVVGTAAGRVRQRLLAAGRIAPAPAEERRAGARLEI
jgi:hypothetical protein